MINKTLIIAAALASTIAIAAPAQAGVDIDLNLGVGGGFYPGYGYPVYDEPVYHGSYYGISCGQGRQAVKYAGFHKVKAVNCSGKRFTYRARQGGETFFVKVSRKSGNIVSVQEAY